MQQTLLTVCIPTYNRANYLRKAIQSALSNSMHDLEVLVVDNASPDHTPEVVAEFTDSRLRYIRNESNIGPVNNFWKCVNSASSDRVVFLTDDDLMLPGAISDIRSFFETHSPAAFKPDLITHLEKSRQSFYYAYHNHDILPNKASNTEIIKTIFSAHIMTGLAFDKSKIKIPEDKHSPLFANIYPSILIMALAGCQQAYLAKPCFIHTWENELFWGDIDPDDEDKKLRQICDIFIASNDSYPAGIRNELLFEFLLYKCTTHLASPFHPALDAVRSRLSSKQLRFIKIEYLLRMALYQLKRCAKWITRRTA